MVLMHCYYVIVYMVLLRKQEFEQAALQFFCAPSEHRQWYYHWQKRRLQWWKQVRYNLCLWYTQSDPPLLRVAAPPKLLSYFGVIHFVTKAVSPGG